MPRFIQPKTTTQHRVAAIALYRALLSRCSSAPLCDDDRTALGNAVRNKFRKNRKLESAYQLGLSFKAGYEALDHLDASATGDAESVAFLHKIIPKIPCALKRKPWVRPPPAPKKSNERLACLPPERAVVNVRPYAKTSGPRHVPILASANGIPFLRFTKPQPPALSRIIRQRLKRKIDLFDSKVLLCNWWLPLCQHEEEWDDLIDEQLKEPRDSVKWTRAVHRAIQENFEKHHADNLKDKEMMWKMQNIVDLETKLMLEEEGQLIVHEREEEKTSANH